MTEQWKMIHLLYSCRKSPTKAALERAGITCNEDTIQALVHDGIVLELESGKGKKYVLASATRSMLQTFVVANSRWTGTVLRVDYPQAFVIMPFRQTWSDSVYDGMIKPAVEEAGLVCVRGDDPARTGDLMQTVWNQLLASGLIIADISALNANVFYELGLAHALGKDTYILTQQGKNEDATMPADFRGAHYYSYDLVDLEASKSMLRDELLQWASENKVNGVKRLYA